MVRSARNARHRLPSAAAASSVPVAGRTGVATIKAQLANMRDGGFISAHDFFISGGMIAEIDVRR